MTASTFDTPAKRKILDTDGEPYWHKISKGRFIGYRKGKAGGSWVARLGKKRATIGNDTNLTYEQALKKTIAWCEREDVGGNRVYLLEECIKDYVSRLELKKGGKTARETAGRMKATLTDAMLETEVSKLTTAQLEAWLHSLLMSPSSANRVFTMLRAALNNAFRLGIVTTNQTWKNVETFENADKRRELFLTDEQVEALLDAAESEALRALMQAGVYTGARAGELRDAKVKDLDASTRSVKLSGKTGTRDCYLSANALAFFQEQCRSKLPHAPLLMDTSGNAWKPAYYLVQLKRAARRAELPPETVFYSLRHYHISKAVGAGISLLAVARNCGTSVSMIEKHYGKFTPQNMADMMDLVQLGSK